MAEKVVAASLKLDADQANKSVKSFKQELREAQTDLLSIRKEFGELSPEALSAAKRVAELKDNIKDAAEVTNLFDPGAKFQVFGNVIRTVTGGFSALTGAMSLVGVESEAVEKSLLKVQSALALTEGVNTIVDSVKDFKRLKAIIQQTTIFQKANNAATAAAAAVQKLFAGAVDTTSTSFKILKGAIVATGIGALVVGIGFLIEKLMSMSSASKEAAEKQKELAEAIKKSEEAALQAGLAFINNEEALALARAKVAGASEEELFNIRQKAQDERIQSLKRNNADEQKIWDAQNKKEVDALEFQAKKKEKIREEEKKARDKALAEEKAARDRYIQERLTNEQQAQAQIRKLQLDNDLALIQDEDERRKQRVIRETEFERERIANLNLSAQTRLELLRQINANEVIELESLEEERKEREAQQDKDRLQAGLDRNLAALQAFAEAKKKDAEEQKAIDQAVFESRMSITRTYTSALGSLSDLIGKQTKAGKIAALAQIAADTAIGFIQALRIAQQTAAGTGPAAAFAFPAFYASQIAAVLAAATRAKGILSSGGNGSVGSPTASATPTLPQAPLTPTPQVATTAIDQNSINAIGNAAVGGVNAVRAYVVEQDSQAAVQRSARLAGAAILGG